MDPAELLRSEVQDVLVDADGYSINVYPYEIFTGTGGFPETYAQLYTGVEAGGGLLRGQRSSVVYLRIISNRKRHIDAALDTVDMLDGYTGRGMRWLLNTTSLTEGPDGELISVSLYDVGHINELVV